MKADYIVLKRTSDNELVYWRVPRRRATRRIWALLSKIHQGELEVVGLVERVLTREEATKFWQLNMGLSGEDLLSGQYTLIDAAKN